MSIRRDTEIACCGRLAGNDGKGSIDATLGDKSVTLSLKDGAKAKGATLDRFGLFSAHIGGSFVRISFDDLKYTTRARR